MINNGRINVINDWKIDIENAKTELKREVENK